eukprot:jgi/Mesvir1/10557/Mv21782-RA.2
MTSGELVQDPDKNTEDSAEQNGSEPLQPQRTTRGSSKAPPEGSPSPRTASIDQGGRGKPPARGKTTPRDGRNQGASAATDRSPRTGPASHGPPLSGSTKPMAAIARNASPVTDVRLSAPSNAGSSSGGGGGGYSGMDGGGGGGKVSTISPRSAPGQAMEVDGGGMSRTASGGGGSFPIKQASPARGAGVKPPPRPKDGTCLSVGEFAFPEPIQPPARVKTKDPPRRPLPPPGVRTTAPAARAMLDGYMLVEYAGVQQPDEVEYVSLVGAHIGAVQSADLEFFTRLASMDASENAVAMGSLATLPALRRLNLACNGAVELDIPPQSFQLLEMLDLSFNSLAPASLACLASLPRLKELKLDSNGLEALPPFDAGREAGDPPFPCLEKLSLSSNELTGSVFACLGPLPALLSLNLSHNRIRKLPPDAFGSGRWPKLALLDLSHNALEHEDLLLPLVEARALRELFLLGNPLVVLAGASADSRPSVRRDKLMDAAAKAKHHFNMRWHLYPPTPAEDSGSPFAYKRSLPKVNDVTGPTPHGSKINFDMEKMKAALERLVASGQPTSAMATPGDANSDEEEEADYRLGAGGSTRRSGSREFAGADDMDDDSSDEEGIPRGRPTMLEIIQGLGIKQWQPYNQSSSTNITQAVKALQYALDHPLVEIDPKPKPYERNTQAGIIRQKLLKPIERPKPKPKVEAPDPKEYDAIHKIETLLDGMRARLAQVETSLRQTMGVQE